MTDSAIVQEQISDNILEKPISGEYTTIPAGVALFYANEKSAEDLHIQNPETIVQQAEQRRNLYINLKQIFNADEIDHLRLENLYNELSNFLFADPNHARLILYLPFEIFPEGCQTIPSFHNLKTQYTDAWTRIIFERDVRASFVDGDVLEDGMGEPVRVRKAGHLIPDLLKKNLLDLDWILDLYTCSEDDEIQSAIAEGLHTAHFRNIISADALKNIRSVDSLIQQTSIIESHQKSEKRIVWEQKVQFEKDVQLSAQAIAEQLQQSAISVAQIIQHANDESFSTQELLCSAIEGITLAVENNRDHSLQLYEESKDWFLSLWETQNVTAREYILSAMRRLHRLNIVPTDDLEIFGITVPDVSHPFPIYLEKIEKSQWQSVMDITERIKNDAELSTLLYPFALTFGSKVKGYDSLSSDTDIALFFRPEAQITDREHILKLLHSKVDTEKVDKILEFWVESSDQSLFRTSEENSETTLNELQIHFLLGGVWIGKNDEQQDLYKRIVNFYLQQPEQSQRSHYLRQLELDILQYRLMHKGFRSQYPIRSREVLPVDLIDQESDFWDSGYRKVASLLYVSRVFLP